MQRDDFEHSETNNYGIKDKILNDNDENKLVNGIKK